MIITVLIFGCIPMGAYATGGITIEINGNYNQTTNTIGTNGKPYEGDTLEDAILKAGEIVAITKLKITGGDFTIADWNYIKSLTAMTNFEIDSEVTVKPMPDALYDNTIFENCIESVQIPQATTIGSSAFKDCTALTTVDILNATTIGGKAFSKCRKLTTVSFPNVTIIGDFAFQDCTVLETLKLGAIPPTVNNDSFTGTPKTKTLGYLNTEGIELTGAALTNAQKVYEGTPIDNLWWGWSIVSVAATGGITIEINGNYDQTTNTIGKNGKPYEGDTLEDAILKAGEIAAITKLKIIRGDFTETDWKYLESLTAMTNFEIDSEVTVKPMPDVELKPSSLRYDSIFACSIQSVKILKETPVGGHAFCKCTALTTVDVPKATEIGYCAFSNCEKLTIAKFPVAKNIEENAFAYCEKLTTVNIPKVTDIKKYTFFECKELTTVNVPEVITIGYGAFWSCKALITVDFSKATTINTMAFIECDSLTTVAFPKAKNIESRVFKECPVLETLKLGAIPPTVNKDSFEGTPQTKTLVFLNTDGTELTGDVLTSAQNSYKNDDDGNTSDNLWYGWSIVSLTPAKIAAENMIYSDMTQEIATDEQIIKAALEAKAKGAVNAGTVNVTVNKKSYVAPSAGTSANSAGKNGSFAFTVSVSKGGETQTTIEKTIIIVATPYVIVPTYEIKGTVQDDSSHDVSGATVKIMYGKNPVGLSVQTDAAGKFTISGISNGIYNLVVSKEDITVTTKVVVDSVDCTISNTIKLPSGKKNSVVEVKENTPSVVVSRLNLLFENSEVDNKEKGITSADNNVVTSGGSVEIKLTAEQKDDTVTNATTISAKATASGKTVGIFMDLSVLKTVKDSNGDEITSQSAILTELPSLIDVFIPLPSALQGKSNYVVYRYHGTNVDEITTSASKAGEYFTLETDMITLHVKKFSIYGIGYTIATTNNTGGHKSNSAVASTITADQSEGGKIIISDDKKNVTISPDDGYVIANVMVDGKSIGATEKYAFADSKNHTITPVFVKETTLPYYIKDNQKVYIGFSDITKNLYKYIAPDGVNVKFRENPKNFIDNTIAWAKPSIDFVTERELFLGTNQDKFGSNECMTRAMFVTAIGRLYERSYGSVAGTSTFSDVDVDAYYAKYVAWADVKDSSLEYVDSTSISSWAIDGAKYCQEIKVITGRNGGNFAPQESATRAEVAVVIDRFIKTIVK